MEAGSSLRQHDMLFVYAQRSAVAVRSLQRGAGRQPHYKTTAAGQGVGEATADPDVLATRYGPVWG